jgi:hypothetical protein
MNNRNGAHFFGLHTARYNDRVLKNTRKDDFDRHIKQFDKFQGCEVLNCTPGSDLKKFPLMALRKAI